VTALGRFAELFVTPALRPAEPVVAEARPQSAGACPVVVMVGPQVVVARDVAGALARAHRRPALVATWGADPSSLRPRTAARSAAREATRLISRGHSALACGRTVDIALDADDAAAAAELWRVLAAWGEGPVVVALCGARGPQFDAVLRASDLAVVATAGASLDGLEHIAYEGLREVAPAVCAVVLQRGGLVARLRNRAGVAAICEALP
jgi:hypothetical protein